MLPHDDAQPRAGAAARLPLDLEKPPADDDRVVGRDHALVFLTEDGVEIDGAERHEGVGGIERRPTKGTRCAAGGRAHGDTRFAASTVRMPATRNSFTSRPCSVRFSALTASARLRGVRRDVLDAELVRARGRLASSAFYRPGRRLWASRRPSLRDRYRAPWVGPPCEGPARAPS